MKLQNSNQFGALIVGSSADSFSRYAADLLCQKDVRFITANDVYQATAILAKEAVNDPLIIGSLRQLSKEQGCFFDIIAAKHFTCCCLDDPCLPKARLPTVNAHATILIELAELRNIIDQRFEQTFDTPAMTPDRCDSNLMPEQFRTTKEELDALLGFPANDR